MGGWGLGFRKPSVSLEEIVSENGQKMREKPWFVGGTTNHLVWLHCGEQGGGLRENGARVVKQLRYKTHKGVCLRANKLF